ncbi:MAG: response regulator [Pseudomonadota bacterium]
MSFRVVLADDETLARSDLKEMLAEMGHKVVGAAADGVEALHLIGTTDPDLVLLDIKMPGLDGIEVAGKIGSRCPAIILTAYSERNLLERARDAGVMAYVTKPFRKADLAAAIELAVSNFLRQSTLRERVDRLKDQLETRKLVEKAKGLLMNAENLTEAQAHQRLLGISMSKNQPLKKVAKATILMFE